MPAVASRTYKSKTSPQEVVVFGLKFKPMSAALALIMGVALISVLSFLPH